MPQSASNPSHRQVHGRAFTLVEILVAMFILSIMMLMVMQILLYSQRTWSRAASRTQIYENARVAIDLVERDLRSSVTSALANRQIGMYVGDPDPKDAAKSLDFRVVASTDPPTTAYSRLAEISYRFHTDRGSSTSSLQPFTLYRQVVTDHDTINWDFYNRPTNWYLNNKSSSNLPPYEKVIGGVASFHVSFYDENDDLIPPDTDSADMPLRIEIYLAVFDERLVDAPEDERFRTQRAFTKILSTGDLQSN